MNDEKKKGKILISKNGPYKVSGNLPMKKEIIESDDEGFSWKWKNGEKYPDQEKYNLCRCGHSKNKPYCDLTHIKIDFDGTETDSRKKYSDRAEKIEGPELDLTDAVEFCSSARFCDRCGGTWELTEKSDDPESKKNAIQQTFDCPSGRLVAWNKKASEPIEPELEESLSITEDPGAQVSGPIWVKGGVEIESANGTKYEKRNRVTLCRCGKSRNKPFCDGSHIPFGFNDSDKSINT
jgi:CDGSH-type Zn-finger protein